jgi:5-formyltetrahydrofolate cyclo-ligase
MDLDQAKQEVRERIWALLDAQKAVLPPGAWGRIPNFVGADAAADRLATLPVWQAARVVKAVPDKAQLPVRARALAEGKLVYMAVPKLADAHPFYQLDPHDWVHARADEGHSRLVVLGRLASATADARA